MKKITLVILFLTGLIPLWADGVSDQISLQRKQYLNWQFGPSMRTGLTALDSMYSTIMTNLLPYVPEFASHQLSGTNIRYEFNGGGGFSEFSFQVGKIMTNQDAQVQVDLLVTPSEIERFYSLTISWDFLQDKGGYTKEKITRSNKDYEYLRQGDTAWLLFVFDQEEATQEIRSGMLVRLDVRFLKSSSKAARDKQLKAYIYELVGSLKWKSLQAMLK